MSGLQRPTSWVIAGATSGAALVLCACGASSYRSEHAPERAAETCGAAETVSACEQRLQTYASQLDALVGPLASAPGAPPPAPGQIRQESLAPPELEAPAEVHSAPAPEAASEAYEADEAGGSERSAPPDCDAARDLRDRICELAAAICELAARSDAAAETKTTCDSSRTSCEQARTRVAAACPG
ncbi:MAG TPA: hypothetical protein VK509_24225 [Polyangiales bacterium]|nr:hypothetical protein [Polyangiales bacterium]